MTKPDIPATFALPGAAEVVHVYDPKEMDTTSRITQRLASTMHMYSYKLQDRALLRQHFDLPITSHYTRRLGSILVSNVGDRFATQLDIRGDGVDWYCFNAMLAGKLTMSQDGREATSEGVNGLVFRALPGTRTLASDGSGRTNVWIEAVLLEGTLERMLGERLHRPIVFNLGVAWDQGLAASLRAQFRYLVGELGRSDGLADNAVALASFSDLVVQTALHGIPHNYTERLVNGGQGAVPAYMRRADDFMRAHAAAPIRMEDVAAASGCSMRTLEVVYKNFRDITPLAALHAIRLEQVCAALHAHATNASTAEVARRYGFTNPARFGAAYRRRFGEAPPRRPGQKH